MNLQSLSRKLVVLAFVAALLVGLASTVSAQVTIDFRPEIILIGDEEPVSKPGHGMISIMDTIMVRVTLSPGDPDSIDQITVDLRKYGGDEAAVLNTYQGRDAFISNVAWVPVCSVLGQANADVLIVDEKSISCPTDTWVAAWDDIGSLWVIAGLNTGPVGSVVTGTTFYWEPGPGDTVFSFVVTDTLNICCNVFPNDCDHFEWETHEWIPPDTVWTDTLVVSDADSFWIDNTPCPYIGHDDPTVLVTAYMTAGYTDTMSSYPPVDIYDNPVDWDTHWTTYIVQWPRLYPVEFQEHLDYYFGFITDNAGWGAVFDEPDNILNPASCLSPTCDVCSVYVDTRKLAHENGNDDILWFAWDAHLFGGTYQDTNWYHVGNPYYAGILCPTEDNGVTGIFNTSFYIQQDSIDVGPGEQLPMIWISDSGDTTWFGNFSNTLLAIDNQIPGFTDGSADTVWAWDITFEAEMGNAGSPNHLNPVSEGNPTPDWLQVKLDLAGMHDLADVEDGGRAFASMMYIGYYMGTDYVAPLLDNMVEMFPLSPIWGTPETDVIACPPSPYCYDQDSIWTYVHVFDNAGNSFCVGAWDTTFAVDNILPFVDAGDCSTNLYIWTEISEDVAFKTGYANVGMPEQNIHGNEYVDRDRIVLHANLGDALGVDEVLDVTLIDNPYCNDPVPFLYDDGLSGGDPVMADKNYTGHTRIQVSGILPLVCILDTDELEQGFEVLVTDDAGNAAINASCVQPKVDNEPPWMSPEHVSIIFWDDPETFGIDGDKDGDGIVTVGDEIIFEWRAQDEVVEDGEIDSVRVNLASIDSCLTGWQNLYWRPPGGIYRNWWPDTGPPGGRPPGAALFVVDAGCVDGEELCADFKVWDNAGNTNGWENFCSGLILDNVSAIIDCADFDITVSGPDTVAAVGDTIFFYYDGPETDVDKIAIYIGELSSSDSLWLAETASWEGYFVVEEGDVDDDAYMFDVSAWDEVGNEYICQAGPVAVDNMLPTMECNVLLRLFDYVDMVPFRVVNVGDNLTAGYWDGDGDIVKVTADFSNYGTQIGTDGVVNLVPEFDGGLLYYWGYRVDPVPDGDIDQPAGGLGTMVLFEVWDDAGNYNSMWVCPKRIRKGGTPNPIMNPSDAALICNSSCVAVDIIRPEPVPEGGVTFELLEASNDIANVGDNLRIIVNMGDPDQPGYDMQWEYGFVQADIHQYGMEYGDLDDYLYLTDRAFSAGGEGDGRFSYHFYDEDAGSPDGQTLIEGAPILPDDTQLPAGDLGTRIKVRAMDDAGNFSIDWTWSDVLVHSEGGHEVPVDNQIPEIEPDDISFSYVDNDENGMCDIGDEITIVVDMTDAPGGGVTGVWGNLYDWGYPSMDKVALTANSPVYSITFTAVRNPGNFCEDGVLIEDEACGRDLPLLAGPPPAIHPEVEVMAQDASDNWSAYFEIGPPYGGPFIPQIWPEIHEWPFMPDWSTTGPMDHIAADTDAPDPLNPTYQFNGSDIRAYSLVDGAIGLKFYYERDNRNQDVQRFFVYGDIAAPGTVDFSDYLGEAIPVGDVPTSFQGMMNRTYVWVSDFLPERPEPYHFAVLAVDNANNYSDWELTWTTGDYADGTAPDGFVKAFDSDDHQVDLGNEEAYFLAYLNSDYYEILYNEWWARIKDLDPGTEGDQPGEWKLIDEDGYWPQSNPYNYLEAPYHCYASFLDCATDNNGHPEDCFDLIVGECYTFEVCMIPWDTEGNHISKDEAEKFVFTYDNWNPVMTYWSVDGHPSPTAERWVVDGTAPMVARAHDGCDLNDMLTWETWLMEFGGMPQMAVMLDSQTLPEGEDYNFDWDISTYPQGDVVVGLGIIDEAGNETGYMQFLEIIDTYAPGGRFAFWKEIAIFMGHFSHPEFLKVVDGMGLRCESEYPMTFWVQWPSDVPFGMYDIGQVEISYSIPGSLEEMTHIATLTDFQDSLTFDGSIWVGYDYVWDTSIFDNGVEITLHAEVMDEVGNTTSEEVDVFMDCGAPVLAIDIPEAMEVCGENRVKGPFNVTATETTVPVDTYLAFWAYKKSDHADVSDCDLGDDYGWQMPIDSLMILDLTTPETIWRATIDPATEGMMDGSWDIVIMTEDVYGNWSWDKNGDWCIDAGYFAWAQANGMGMTIVIDNEAPEVRIRTVETDDHVFEPIDQGWLWPMLPYAQCDNQVTVSCWTESDCDVARVEYWLDDSSQIIGGSQMVGWSTEESDGYEVTFPGSGDICDYLVPGAMQNGHVTVLLIAELTDVLGNISHYYIDLTLVDIEPASAFITAPLDGICLGGEIALKSTAINNDELYDVTYEYSVAGSQDWTHIATTRPHDGAPWDTDINGDTIYWNTWGLSGAYDLRAVSRDANLMVDPDPSYITVQVDNEPAVATLMISGDGVLDTGGTLWVGGDAVIISVDIEDAGCGMECVTFYYKETEQSFNQKVAIGQPDCVPPFANLWDDCAGVWSFCAVQSGEYQIIARLEGKSGVVTYVEKTIYVDHWSPEAWITQVEDGYNEYDTVSPQDPCCCYDVWGVVEFTGWAEDLVSSMYVANFAMNSGLNGAQFQYREYDPSGCNGGLLKSEPGNGDAYWTNLGEPIWDDEGPYYTQTWDTGMLVPGYYAVRMVGIDLLGNRADSYCGNGYEPPFVCIQVVDMVPPVAVIAGVDDVTGYVWACFDTHGQDDAAFVRFEYSSDKVTWTPIGEIDECISNGLFGVPWHFATLSGDFSVRAVAFDDDYDPIDNPDLYDKDPATMLVTIADGTVTMDASEMITGIDRWGNLEWCDMIKYEVVSDEKPCVIGVFDSDPMDHFNVPWAQWRDQLINPDDPTIWADHFDISQVDPYGTLTIIATYNDDGTVGAVTDRIYLYKVSSIEGTRGYVSQDGMKVSVPAGALDKYNLDGLLMIKVAELIADPSIDDMVALGDPVMMTLLDHGNCDHYHFYNGNRAHLCMDYDDADIPEGYAEDDLRIAFWDQGGQEWILDGDIEIVDRTVDTETNEVCVYVDQTGTYSVVAATPLRITKPIFDPRCDGERVVEADTTFLQFTGPIPAWWSIIEDLGYGYIDEIMVVLNGPADDVIYNNMIIYHGGWEDDGPVLKSSASVGFDYTSYGAGWYGSYNFTSNTLRMKVIAESDWDSYWDYWFDYQDWFLFWGDRISDGLPAGDYTLDIFAQNESGDEEHITHAFFVDATAPTVDFKGKYVMADPEFMLTVMDTESGVNTDAIFLDIFGIQPDDEVCCENWVELEDYLGTATPSAIEFADTSGGYVVTFGDMAYGLTLSHGMSIDVIVYDGTFTYGDCEYGDCRQYYTTDGVADCAENHANPVWRRFTVDDKSPEMVETSDDSATEVEISICDELAGVDVDAFMVDGVYLDETDYDWTWTPINSQCGILRIDVGDGAVDIDVTATDKAGNMATIEINKGSATGLDVTGWVVYPVPFDPDEDGAVSLQFTLSNTAHVFCKIYDFAGLPVYLVEDDWKEPGEHILRWFGSDESGNPVAPGAYIAYIKVDDGTKVVTENLKIAVGGVKK